MVNKHGRIELRPGECMFDGERWFMAVMPCNCDVCALRLGPCDFITCAPIDGRGYHLVEVSAVDCIMRTFLKNK